MLVVSFFSWWYGRGWKQVLDNFGPRLKRVADSFSVTQLLGTLFAPWRRIISYPGRSLAERFRAWGDNVFSRVVGFVVRVIVLITACLVLFVVAIVTLLELVLWPLVPLAVPACIIAGVIV